MAQRNAKKSVRLTNNGYLNFLSEFRQRPESAKLSVTEAVRKGASIWRTFTDAQKQAYKNVAKMYGRSSASAQKRGTQSNSQEPTKKKPNNAYINFLSVYRKKPENSKVLAKDVVRKGAKLWSSLTSTQKESFKFLSQKIILPWKVNTVNTARTAKRQEPTNGNQHDDVRFKHFVRLFAGRVCSQTKSQMLEKATKVWDSWSDEKKERCYRLALQKYAKN